MFPSNLKRRGKTTTHSKQNLQNSKLNFYVLRVANATVLNNSLRKFYFSSLNLTSFLDVIHIFKFFINANAHWLICKWNSRDEAGHTKQHTHISMHDCFGFNFLSDLRQLYWAPQATNIDRKKRTSTKKSPFDLIRTCLLNVDREINNNSPFNQMSWFNQTKQKHPFGWENDFEHLFLTKRIGYKRFFFICPFDEEEIQLMNCNFTEIGMIKIKRHQNVDVIQVICYQSQRW